MKGKSKSTLENLALLSQVGLMMLVPIIGGVLVGVWVDQRLGSGYFATITFLLLGVGASFRNLMVLGTRKSKEYENSQTPEQYVKAFEKKLKNERENDGK